MSHRLALPLVAVLAVVPISTDAPGRFVEDWPYDRMLRAADLVVLANAVETELTNDRLGNNPWPRELVGQNTTFNVNLVLKGDPQGGRIQVLHFTFGKPKNGVDPIEAGIIINGPLLVTFQKSYATLVKGINMPPPEYLLFLRKRKDGRYDPVSGQIDPEFSVRQVFKQQDPFEIDWDNQPRPR